MKKTFVLATTLFLASCGDESGGSSEPSFLEKSDWVIDYQNDCGLGLSFRDGGYSISQLCLISYSVAYSQVEAGTVKDLGDGRLEFTPKKSSCKGVSGGDYDMSVDIIPYKLDKQLFLTVDGGVLAFAKNPPSSTDDPNGGYSISFGCFVDKGFVESPLR